MNSMTRKPYVATYTFEEWRGVTLYGDSRVEWLPPGDSRRPTYDPDPDAALARVHLSSGRLRRHAAGPTDEGDSYTSEEVEQGQDDDGKPCWVIQDESGGRDCDGNHARYWKGVSYGGLPRGAWLSPSTEVSASVYDQYARMAGY